MPKLSDHLSNEPFEGGNLPFSPECIVRVRTDIANDVKAAQTMLSGVAAPAHKISMVNNLKGVKRIC